MPDNNSKIGSEFWALTLLTNYVVVNSYSDGFAGSQVVLSSLAETGDLTSSNCRSTLSMHA